MVIDLLLLIDCLQVARLKAQLAAAMCELDRWRSGEKVPESEWIRDGQATHDGSELIWIID